MSNLYSIKATPRLPQPYRTLMSLEQHRNRKAGLIYNFLLHRQHIFQHLLHIVTALIPSCSSLPLYLSLPPQVVK